MINHLIKDRIHIIKDIEVTPPIECSPTQINQVLMNLLVNAAQAIEKEGQITINVQLYGDNVVIRIIDTGCGIPQEHIPQIFDPFFTTKDVGKGTGMGLSISIGIITEHQGTLEVESSSELGTVMRMTLPIKRL